MFGSNDDDKQQPIKDDAGSALADPATAPEPVFREDALEEPATIASDSVNNNPVGSPVVPPEPVKSDAYSPPTFTPQGSQDGNEDPDLLNLKQKALQDLSPIVGHLDQTPEEKFKTTMMMIQASDNQKLLPDAYKAAQAITDDKAKAQALLDVINEINYFTQAK